MIIVYLHQYFKTPSQAGGTRSYEMAKRLVEWGHEVHMISSCAEENYKQGWQKSIVDGINVHLIPIKYSNRMGFYSRIMAFLHFSLSSARYAATLKGDLIFATSTPLTIALPGMYAAWISRKPMVFEVRDLWPDVPIAMGEIENPIIIFMARVLERLAYKRSSHIVALSNGMRNGVIKSGIASEKVSVIPNSADLKLFDPINLANNVFREEHHELGDSPLVLYPGTLGRVNGVGYLAKVAFHTLKRKSNVKFVIIGDGSEKEKIELLAKGLGVFGVNFFMYPSMPKNKLVNAFADSALIVSTVIAVPALEANSANKFFDALAAAKAVAINYGGWQKEIIEAEKLGLCLPQDAEQAAEIMVDFFATPGAAEECGFRARGVAVRDYSRDALARNLENIFCSVVGSGVIKE